jgi:hypothetical protein
MVNKRSFCFIIAFHNFATLENRFIFRCPSSWPVVITMKKKLANTWKKNRGYRLVQMNGNKFATGQIVRKPVEVVKGRISAGWTWKSPEPWLEEHHMPSTAVPKPFQKEILQYYTTYRTGRSQSRQVTSSTNHAPFRASNGATSDSVCVCMCVCVDSHKKQNKTKQEAHFCTICHMFVIMLGVMLIVIRVEAPITDHWRDYAQDLEQYIRRCKLFQCRKIEIRRITKIWSVYSLTH